MAIVDVYKLLFGRKGIADGNVIDMAEHGRAGGVSTGTAFKMSRDVDEKTLVDEPDATTTYVGKAKQGGTTSDAVWQIKKISVSGTVTSITYADSDDLYDNIWDNRTSLNYG